MREARRSRRLTPSPRAAAPALLARSGGRKRTSVGGESTPSPWIRVTRDRPREPPPHPHFASAPGGAAGSRKGGSDAVSRGSGEVGAVTVYMSLGAAAESSWRRGRRSAASSGKERSSRPSPRVIGAGRLWGAGRGVTLGCHPALWRARYWVPRRQESRASSFLGAGSPCVVFWGGQTVVIKAFD